MNAGENRGGGQVALAHPVLLELPVQGDLAFLVLGEKDQPLGRQVEAVDRRRPVADALAVVIFLHAVQQVVDVAVGRGLHRHPAPFVNDQQMVVFDT